MELHVPYEDELPDPAPLVRQHAVPPKYLITAETIGHPTMDYTVESKFVFDFDCTLTTNHFYRFINQPEVFTAHFENRINKNKFRNPDDTDEEQKEKRYSIFSSKFREYITGVGENHVAFPAIATDIFFGGMERLENIKKMFVRIGKNNLYIMTRGIRDHILKLLVMVGLHDFVDDLNVCGGEIFKVRKILQLLQTHNVFYFDDDKDEHNIIMNNYDSVSVDYFTKIERRF